MLEIAAVAKAAGYEGVADAKTVETQLARCMTRPYPGVQPSMMADALEGREMEVDAVVGEIVRIGRKLEVTIPHLETLFVLLQGLDVSLRQARKS